MPKPANIIIRIPGPWASRVEIITSVARSRTGYLFADDLLLNTRTQQLFSVLVGDFNPQMETAFSSFSNGNIDDATLEAIRAHRHSLYLTAPAYHPNDARAAMRAARALLTSGGIAVLVESSGKVHTAAEWQALQARASTGPDALYEAFVLHMLDGPNRTYYTVGMHNLGLRDAIFTGNLLTADLPALVRRFLLGTIEAGEGAEAGTLPTTSDGPPAFRVTAEPCATFPAGNVYHNPHGMWRLELVD